MTHVPVAARLLDVFALDLRALALFRALLGVLIAINLGCRSSEAGVFLSDAGVLPRALRYALETGSAWSLADIHGSAAFQRLLLVIGIAAALALALGYRSRMAALTAWAIVISVQHRNPFMVVDIDVLLAALLFWALFLPLNGRWSMDAALSITPPPSSPAHRSIASAALLLQILLTPTVVLTASGASATLVIGSLLLPLLALSPWGTSVLRLVLGVGAVTAILFVGSVAPLTSLPWIGLTMLVALVPTEVWNRLTRQAPRPPHQHLRIFYDEDCGFCLKCCLILKVMLILPAATPITPAQQNPRAKALMDAQWSWVILDRDDRAHLKWAAMVALIRESQLLGWSYRLWALSLWTPIGNRVYDFVATHRGAIAGLTAPLMRRRDEVFVAGRGLMLICGVALLMQGVTIVAAVLAPTQTSMAPLRQVGLQPVPIGAKGTRSDASAWLVMPGRLADGREVELLSGQIGAVAFDQPPVHDDPFASVRATRYIAALGHPDHQALRTAYARYHCDRRAAAAEGQRLTSFSVELVRPFADPRNPSGIERRVLSRHRCDAVATASPVPDLLTDDVLDDDRDDE